MEEVTRKNSIINSKKYQDFYNEQVKWLTELAKTDSTPGDGRLDISVFNTKVAEPFGWKKPDNISSDERYRTNGHQSAQFGFDRTSVSIYELAKMMADQKFEL